MSPELIRVGGSSKQVATIHTGSFPAQPGSPTDHSGVSMKQHLSVSSVARRRLASLASLVGQVATVTIMLSGYIVVCMIFMVRFRCFGV